MYLTIIFYFRALIKTVVKLMALNNNLFLISSNKVDPFLDVFWHSLTAVTFKSQGGIIRSKFPCYILIATTNLGSQSSIVMIVGIF